MRATRTIALTGLLTAAIGVVSAPVGAAAPTTGVGQVFMVNPVQSSGNQNLIDDKDSATAVPAAQYVLVPLRNLDGSGTLTGRWVTVRSETGDPARAADGRFVYNRHDDRFEQVMAYFWVNQGQEYLQSLGFGGALPAANPGSPEVRSNQW